MGGQIHLQSEIGRGSTFTILMAEGNRTVADLRECFRPWPPMTESTREWARRTRSAERVVTTSPAGASGPAPHVLVVDDEPSYRDVVWQALREDCRVTRAADGESAVEVLRAETVDVILLDLFMPGMSGYDVLTAIRSERLGGGAPVITASTHLSRAELENCLALGAADHLDKPFQRAQLRCRIFLHLELHSLRRGGIKAAEAASV
jgi:CheY-like chemotaxis protein